MSDQSFIFEQLIKRRADLERRRSDVLRRLDDLNREQERLDQETKEVEIAQRVLKSLSAETDSNEKSYIPPHTKIGRKPEGIPTIAEMIETALSIQELFGADDGLESHAIIQHIRGKWWPDAQGNDIAPLLWRLVKQGKLAKNGNKYHRIEKDGAPPNANGAKK